MNQNDTAYIENYKKQYVQTCPKCQGTDSYCSCWAGLRSELKKIKSNIPVKFRDFTFEKFTHPQLEAVKQKIHNYCEDIPNLRFSGNCIYIHGTKGLAKTASAQLILMHALERGFSARYVESLTSYSEQIMQSWDDKEDTTDYTKMITEPEFLVLDRVGEGLNKPEAVVSKIKRAFQIRAGSMLPTIFISMVDLKQIKDPTECYILDFFKPVMSELKFEGFDYVEHVLKKVKATKKVK